MRSLLLGLLAALPALAQAQQPHPEPVATRVQVRGADCALFPVAVPLGGWWGEELENAPRFAPTPAQATEVEGALPQLNLADVYDPLMASLRGYYARYPAVIHQRLPEYQRQYFGFYNAQHQPCLFVNFFAEKMEYAPGVVPGWLRYPVQVADGGAGFWHVCYNLSTHRFYNFSHGLEG